jgi:hypothetical protein
MISYDDFKKYYPDSKLIEEQVDNYSEVVESMIEDRIGYPPEKQSVLNETEDARITRSISTIRKPLLSVERLQINNTELISSDYFIQEGMIYLGNRLDLDTDPYYLNEIELDYTYGIDKNDIPKSLEYAIAGMIERLGTYGVSQDSILKKYKIESVSYEFKEFKEMIEPYLMTIDKVFS